MKLSTRGRYGVRAMVDLALHYGRGHVLLKDIAKRQRVSEKYLQHIITPLKMSGLVRSIRGAHGGYTLAKLPAQIKLSQIIGTLEGSTAPVECVDESGVCSQVSTCVTRDIWVKVKRATDKILDSTTLQSLINQQKEKERKMKKHRQVTREQG